MQFAMPVIRQVNRKVIMLIVLVLMQVIQVEGAHVYKVTLTSPQNPQNSNPKFQNPWLPKIKRKIISQQTSSNLSEGCIGWLCVRD